MKRYLFRAKVSTDAPDAVRPILEAQIPGESVVQGQETKEYLVEGTLEGASAKDRNRTLLSALRRGEKRTRLRSE